MATRVVEARINVMEDAQSDRSKVSEPSTESKSESDICRQFWTDDAHPLASVCVRFSNR